jgi:peptidoglycan/LPS O-acetylase OafA/YrhL
MRSSNRQYLPSVDHLRGFAAVLILLYHGTQLFAPRLAGEPSSVVSSWLYSRNPLVTLIGEGHTAVTLFMVLSGFIFTVGTLGHGVSFPRFMGNRLLRIYPLFLLLTFVGLAFAGTFTAGGFFLTLFGLANYTGSALNLGAISAMFWAVAIEMQFYLIFPLLNRILTKSGLLTFVRLLAAVVVVRWLAWVYSGPHHDAQGSLYFNLAGRIDDFLIGMIAAWFFVRYRAWFRGWWKVALASLITLAGLWEFNQLHGTQNNSTWRLGWIDAEALMWALVILTYVATLRSTNVFSRLGSKIGEMSFSIYLLHFVTLQVVMKNRWYLRIDGLSTHTNAFITAAGVLLPLVLVLSWFTYNGVEKPFLSLRMRYLLPAEAAAPVPTAVEPQPEPEPAPVPVPRITGNGHPPAGPEPDETPATRENAVRSTTG